MQTNISSLWEKIISVSNLELAADNALRNKKRGRAMLRFMDNRSVMLAQLRQDLINGKFRTGDYSVKTVFEPKRRDVYILPFYPDRIVHHALMNVISPIWDAQFISDSYACRAGRGIHAASRRMMEFIRRNKYFLQCDIRKFYPSINHDVMYKLVCKSLHAGAQKSPLLDIFRDIIYSIPGETNMPIGNLTSQWLGNLYMNALDRYVKDVLHVRCYVRYCDDFVLFANDKATLRQWRTQVEQYLMRELRLTFSYAEIAPVSNGLDFCGYRHFPHTVLLRRSTLRRFRARIKRLNKLSADERGGDTHIRGQIASMNGWLRHCHSNLRLPDINKTTKGDKK